jgi:hypothetical protein
MATIITSNTGRTKSTDRTAGGSKPDSTPATGTSTTTVTGAVTSVSGSVGVGASPTTGNVSVYLNTTGVTANTYGSSTTVPVIAVNAQGQITSATNTSIAISGGAVSGNIAGNAANVTGTVAIGNGGTGATTAATARTNLGLGTVATQTAPSGTSSQLLANNGFGGFNNVTVGTGLSYSGGTLTSSSSSGTVTSVGTAGSVNGITLTGGPITTSGTVTLGGTLGSIANSQLSNNAITINTSTGLSGGGTVSLGGSLTLTNTVSGLPSGATTSQSLLYNTSTAAWYTEHFNVQSFGATGNGLTDDTTNINLAIAALNAAGGGELYFPKGIYYISATLTTITVPCKIYGAGVQSSSITQHTLTAGVFLITTTLACVIRDINVTSTGTSTGYGISFNPTSYNSSSLINNISVGGFSICLYLNVAFAIVDGCTFGSSTTCVYYTNAVLPDESCGTILNCTFNTSGGTQCIYMEADGLQIMNNYFFAGGSYAIVYNVIANCTNVSDLWIQNNHIEGYSSIAVWIKSPSGYPFSNLQITNNEFSPIVNSTATAIQIDAQGASPAWVSGAYYLTYNCVSYGGVNYELVSGATNTTAGSFVTGRKYKIVDVNNTNFTLIGAAANIANVSFTATGPGTGTGTASNFTSTTIPPSDTTNWAALPYYLQNANLTGNVITSGTTAFSLNGINNATVSANSIQAVTYGVLTGLVTTNIVSRANSFYGVTYPIYDVGTKNFSDLWTGKGVNVTQQNSGGTGFSIANNTETNVSWNRSLYDDGGFYGASTFWSSGNADKITIPSNAYIVGIKRIQLTACINWDPNATGNRQIKIKDNNGNTYGGNLIAGGNTSDFASDYNSTLTCMIDISSMGNPTYFFVTGTQDSGGALNVRSSYGSFFCMEIKC